MYVYFFIYIYIYVYSCMAVYDADFNTDVGRFVQCMDYLKRVPQRLHTTECHTTVTRVTFKFSTISECQCHKKYPLNSELWTFQALWMCFTAVNTCRKKPHGPFAMSPIGSKAMKICTAPRSLKNLCYHGLCIWFVFWLCFVKFSFLSACSTKNWDSLLAFGAECCLEYPQGQWH